MSQLAEPLIREPDCTSATPHLVGADQTKFIDTWWQIRTHRPSIFALPHIRQVGKHTSPTAATDGIVNGVAEPKHIVQKLIQQMLSVSGFSLTKLARQANLAPSTLTKFVNNQSEDIPSTRTLIKLTEATGLALSVLPSRPEARPDPEMLRLAILLALQHVPEDEPNREAELARIGALAYDTLAEETEKRGRPFADDAEGLAFIGRLMRRFLSSRR